MKKTLLSLITIAAIGHVQAQVITSEDFESATGSATSFTSNGQDFDINSTAGGPFSIYDIGTFGWNGTAADSRFIDNSSFATNGLPGSFSISSNDAAEFYVHSFWVYVSKFNLTSLGTGGGITVRGKLGGVTQFTVSETTGFNTSNAVSNGFTLIDLSTYGGSDNSAVNIDELEVVGSGTFEYIALDAFEWETIAPLPVTASDLSVVYRNASPTLIWKTYTEAYNSGFEIQRATDGTNFETVGFVGSKGIQGSSSAQLSYSYSNIQNQTGQQFYRYKQIDIDGKFVYSNIVAITFTQDYGGKLIASPNPTQDKVRLIVPGAGTIIIADISGKVVHKKQVETATEIDFSGLSKGVYSVTFTGAAGQSAVKIIRY